MHLEQSVETLDGLRTVVRKPSKPSSAFDRFAPPADADIEVLLGWAYGTQQAHKQERESSLASASSGMMDSVVKVQRNAIHGGRIDGGGLPPGLPKGGEIDAVHPDAMLVHRAVSILDDLSIGLVINHGWLRTRPEWGGPQKLLRPLVNGKGKPKMICDRSNHPIACHLNPFEIEHNLTVYFQRGQYTHWWEAMLILRAECAELLPHLTITGPIAPERPWENPDLVRKWLDDAKKV
jgi:hypothetical protein